MEPRECHMHCTAWRSYARMPSRNPDLTLGSASILIGLAELLETFAPSWLVDITGVRDRGYEIAHSLSQQLGSDSIASSTELPSLGIAHGWAGLIFALLRWAN